MRTPLEIINSLDAGCDLAIVAGINIDPKLVKMNLELIRYQLGKLVMTNYGFNINTEVTVKLTKEGEKILREYFEQRPQLIKIDENKIYKASLWEIMNIFGKYFYNGCTVLFENNLIMIAVSA